MVEGVTAHPLRRSGAGGSRGLAQQCEVGLEAVVEAAERGSVEGVLDRELEDRGGRGEDDPGLLAGDVGPGGEVLDEGVEECLEAFVEAGG